MREEDFDVKMGISSHDINLDQEFKMTLEFTHPSSYIVDKDILRRQVMSPNSKGIYPLFLAKETETKADHKTTLTYILKPQYPGKISLQLQMEHFIIPPIALNIAHAASYTTSFSPAPLMPLVRGDPLELNLELRKLLYQTSHAHENIAIIKSHSYPFGGAFTVIILMLLAPFALAYLLESRPKTLKTLPLKKRNVLEELYLLKNSLAEEPRALSFKVGELFKEGFRSLINKETASMTFQELLSNLHGQKVNEAEVKRLSLDLENMQFQKSPPTLEEVSGTLDEVTSILIKNPQDQRAENS